MIVLAAPSSFLFRLKNVLSAIITVFAFNAILFRFSSDKKALKEEDGRREEKRAFARLTKKKQKKRMRTASS
jgi:hypothetical protein